MQKNMTVMGRKVVHNSPAKFPLASDPGYDAMLEKADKGLTSGTYGGSRKDMMPAQQESSKPAKLLDYMRKMIGGEKK